MCFLSFCDAVKCLFFIGRNTLKALEGNLIKLEGLETNARRVELFKI